MKNIILIILPVLLLIGCKKDNPPPPSPIDPYLGNGHASLNGENWICDANAFNELNNDTIAINLSKKDDAGVLRELLSFRYVPMEEKRFNLSIFELLNPGDILSAHYSTFIADGDVTGEFYTVNSILPINFIEIKKVDAITTEIEGTFDVLLTIHPDIGKKFPTSPDTLHFTNGEFKVKVKP